MSQELQGDGAPSELFAAFLLPSHYVWLARRRYDEGHPADTVRLARSALESQQRLSPAGIVEACRLLCLASARLGLAQDFDDGISILRTRVNDPWAASNLNFLLGFNARMNGNLPEAELYMREAYRFSPGNFSAARELAHICLVRGNLPDAEEFARESYTVAHDNPYIIDVLLEVLLNSIDGRKLRENEEVQNLLQKLQEVGDDENQSFYKTRRAEYEWRTGNLSEACRIADEAIAKTPNLFSPHALRAQIYLDRGNRTVALDELKTMERMIGRPRTAEKRSELAEVPGNQVKLFGFNPKIHRG